MIPKNELQGAEHNLEGKVARFCCKPSQKQKAEGCFFLVGKKAPTKLRPSLTTHLNCMTLKENFEVYSHHSVAFPTILEEPDLHLKWF